jgi:hypothetical protein
MTGVSVRVGQRDGAIFGAVRCTRCASVVVAPARRCATWACAAMIERAAHVQ